VEREGILRGGWLLWVPGGEEELFQRLSALGMNPPQLIEASRQVGTSILCWLAAVPPLLQNPLLQQRGRGGREAGGEEELFELPDTLGMNSPQPFLSIGPVGTAVLGWLAALVPLLKDLLLEP
jgi:hypothetical protein